MHRGLSWLVLVCGWFVLSCQPLSAQNLRRDSVGIAGFPDIPFLPDPLVSMVNGQERPVTTTAGWNRKREQIKEAYQHWVSGTVPPAPATFDARILSEKVENGVEVRTVALHFGPGGRAKMTVVVMIPPATKPLPVFVTQWNHLGWAQVAVERGYIGCVYAGADMKDDARNYDSIYPAYDFATLMKRAWGCSRAIDYLYTLPQVDTARIALTGHSRNGKQSLMAAAFDTRIKAVVTSSGGTGGESTFRYSDERFDSESLEEITRNFPHWFSPRLRLFMGREQKLPVDQNSLMALIAPRGLMMVSAITETQGNPWGIEQSYRSVGRVYHLLGADSALAILLRRGRHQHARREVEDYIDFFDFIFQRGHVRPENRLYYGYSFDKWKSTSKEHMNVGDFPPVTVDGWMSAVRRSIPGRQDSARKRIRWLLGTPPAVVAAPDTLSRSLKGNSTYPDDYLTEVIGQVKLGDAKIGEMRIGPYHPLGADLWGTVFFPAASIRGGKVAGRLPVVIYLHEYSYATGYHRRSAPVIKRFLDAGYAVVAFDLVGFGTRIEEALHFYDRYPHFSMMGSMVKDTRSIIDDVSRRMPFADPQRIYLAGYSLGGTVALMTAAMDQRVAGVAAVAAFSSFRHDNKGTEGIRHYAQLHGLLPRLGFFVGEEERIPVDFNDILACIAPRPLLVIAPRYDRDHTASAVTGTLADVSAVYDTLGAQGQLKVLTPPTYNHFTVDMQRQIADWLHQQR